MDDCKQWQNTSNSQQNDWRWLLGVKFIGSCRSTITTCIYVCLCISHVQINIWIRRKDWKVYRENRDVLEVITGQRSTLRSNAATPTRTSPKKCSFSLYRKLFVPTYFVKCRQTLLELNSYGPHSGSERDKFWHCLFTYSIQCEIRHSHIVVVQKRAKKCTTKRDTCAKLLFCL